MFGAFDHIYNLECSRKACERYICTRRGMPRVEKRTWRRGWSGGGGRGRGTKASSCTIVPPPIQLSRATVADLGTSASFSLCPAVCTMTHYRCAFSCTQHSSSRFSAIFCTMLFSHQILTRNLELFILQNTQILQCDLSHTRLYYLSNLQKRNLEDVALVGVQNVRACHVAFVDW